MTVLILDIETTGLIRKGVDLHDPSQPRAVEIAWTLEIGEGKRVGAGEAITRAENSVSGKGAAEVHGISERMRSMCGVDTKRALVLFMAHLSSARTVVSYGLPFDMSMLERELRIVGDDGARLRRPGLRRIDLMQAVTDVFSTGKWINLSAAHELVLGAPHEAAHRAAGDRDAAARIYWRLVRDGKLQETEEP